MRLVMFRRKWHLLIGTGAARRRISLRTSDREAAERSIAGHLKADAELTGGTCGTIYKAWKADRERQGKSTETAKHSWKALGATFSALLPSQVTREVCRAYANARRLRGRADGTIIRELGVVKTALYWQDKNSPAVFEMPPAPPPRETHLTREEYVALREVARKTLHLLVFLELAKTTGARPGAVCELPWTRADFDRSLIRLGADVGNKKRAIVPMVDSLRTVLLEAKRAAVTPYVVEFAGKRVRSIKGAFRRAAAAIGRPDITPMTIRHSVAVWMAEDEVPMSEISQYLGHKDTKTTEKHYARYSPSYLRRAARSVDF